MKLKPEFFVRKGNLTLTSALILVVFGFGLSYISLEYAPFIFLKVVGLAVGLAIAAIGGFSGRAKSLEIKPFTNDPIGWRKAKENYLKKNAEEELRPSLDSSVEESKK